jgi:hypothetical protein
MRLELLVVWCRGGNDVVGDARYPRFRLFDFLINIRDSEVCWWPDAFLLALHADVVLSVRPTIHINATLRLALTTMLLRAIVIPNAGI